MSRQNRTTLHLMDSIQEQNSNHFSMSNSINESSSSKYQSCKIQDEKEESVQGDISITLDQPSPPKHSGYKP